MPESSSTIPAARQPVLFVPHGAGPCFFMDWRPQNTWDGMASFLRNIEQSLPERPKAILLISAHWQTDRFTVTSGKTPSLLYDYYGFPDHTYQLRYPAPGAPQLARRIADLLKTSGITAQEDPARGFDHGVFIPLKLMFPEANIPVVQLSLLHKPDPLAHLMAGNALAPLRDEGVLLVGSGMSFHNMRGYGDKRFTGPSEEFDAWLTAAIEDNPEQRQLKLQRWLEAPHARNCHPQGAEEHLFPLLVAAGAAKNEPGIKAYSERVLQTQLSGFLFGTTPSFATDTAKEKL